MNEYTFWFDETETYKAVFTADNDEQAIELLQKVEGYEMATEDLPNFAKTSKGYDLGIGIDTLEEN